MAGTGLLANTGDPANINPIISTVEVKTGQLVNIVADQGLKLADVVDAADPTGSHLVGTVIGVVKATGTALVQTGQGQQYLVDGLTAAPGELVNVTIGQTAAIGSANVSPAIQASLLSPTQANGSLLTVGVASNGNLLTIAPGTTLQSGLQSGTLLGSASGATAPVGGVLTAVSGVTSTLTSGLSGTSASASTSGNASTGGTSATGSLTGSLGGLTGGLTGSTSAGTGTGTGTGSGLVGTTLNTVGTTVGSTVTSTLGALGGGH